MAGGALGGVLGASFRLFSWYGEDNIRTPFYGNEAVSQTCRSSSSSVSASISGSTRPEGSGRTEHADSSLKGLDAATAEALIGIDTLWGGDVMNPSGTGRFIADCWFSDEPLPAAYTHPSAAKLRETGGVGAKAPDKASIEAYVAAVDVKARSRA